MLPERNPQVTAKTSPTEPPVNRQPKGFKLVLSVISAVGTFRFCVLKEMSIHFTSSSNTIFVVVKEAKDSIASDVQAATTRILQSLRGRHFILDHDIDFIASSFLSGDNKRCLETCQWVLDFVWEKLNTGHWKDVDDWWRNAYYLISYIKCTCQQQLGYDLGTCMKTCDLGILLGVRPEDFVCLTKVAADLTELYNSQSLSQQIIPGKLLWYSHLILHWIMKSNLGLFSANVYP